MATSKSAVKKAAPKKERQKHATHATYARVIELAARRNVKGAGEIAKLVGLTVAALGWWRRNGVSQQAAKNMQESLGWNASYIMTGQGEPLAHTAAHAQIVPAPKPIAQRAMNAHADGEQLVTLTLPLALALQLLANSGKRLEMRMEVRE
jgi:hypothetical protein